MRRTLHFVVGAVVMAGLGAGEAAAFGTYRTIPPQNAEHERITKHALQCGGGAVANCFERRPLRLIAGGVGSFGGVGAPDNPIRGLIDDASAHCDNGDFLAGAYAQSRGDADAALNACRDGMDTNMNAAVAAAAGLVDAHGQLRPGQTPNHCSFSQAQQATARCRVLAAFGLVLHASQDFYSHTNWTDERLDGGPGTPSNPPGLGNVGPAPFISLRARLTVPPGLISGCFYLSLTACNGRVGHGDLNKDEGAIDPSIGAARTRRGQVRQNFRRAVEAAIADTQDKWTLLQERLRQRYPQSAERMICAIRSNHPSHCP